MGKEMKEIIQLDREAVIPIVKSKLIHGLATHIDDSTDRQEFYTFCKRVEYTIRAWYHLQFDEMMHLYDIFEPVKGAPKLEERDLTEEQIDELEQKFVGFLFQMMEKSNFKIVSNEEIELAHSSTYSVHLDIKVNEAKLDSLLLKQYFATNPRDHLPYFADQYIIFRRGFGLDKMTKYFITWKFNAIFSRIWQCFLRITGLKRFYARKKRSKYVIHGEQPTGSALANEEAEDDDGDEHDLFIERIRIQNMKLSLGQLISKLTIQEPTFERIIILYRSKYATCTFRHPKSGCFFKNP